MIPMSGENGIPERLGRDLYDAGCRVKETDDGCVFYNPDGEPLFRYGTAPEEYWGAWAYAAHLGIGIILQMKPMEKEE